MERDNGNNEFIEDESLDNDLKMLQIEELETRIELENRTRALVSMLDIILVPITLLTFIATVSIIVKVIT